MSATFHEQRDRPQSGDQTARPCPHCGAALQESYESLPDRTSGLGKDDTQNSPPKRRPGGQRAGCSTHAVRGHLAAALRSSRRLGRLPGSKNNADTNSQDLSIANPALTAWADTVRQVDRLGGRQDHVLRGGTMGHSHCRL
jgi:hypothetical protein